MNNKFQYLLTLAIKATPGGAFISVKYYVFLSCQTVRNLLEKEAGTLMTAPYWIYHNKHLKKKLNAFQI